MKEMHFFYKVSNFLNPPNQRAIYVATSQLDFRSTQKLSIIFKERKCAFRLCNDLNLKVAHIINFK